MKSFQGSRNHSAPLLKIALLITWTAVIGMQIGSRSEAATNVVVWDTGSRLASGAELENRTGWRLVPSETLLLEREPQKAASDPGYYGREYVFTGDAVVENRSLAAVFWSAQGRVMVYSKDNATAPETAARQGSQLGRKILELVPRETTTQSASIRRCAVIRNVADEVVLEVSFSAQGAAARSAVFSFGKTGIVEIKPSEKGTGFRLFSSIEYGVVPGFIGDDLLFGPAQFATANTLCTPSENLFLGLLQGEDRVLVMTWPTGRQQMSLRAGAEREGKRLIESIDFEPDGTSFYLAALAAPGIWHREELKPTYLEKDVSISWKRPFSAKWKTQLLESGVRTTYAFRESKGQIWRGVPGSYLYPVWFDGDAAFYRLSKKVPPKGESLIYFLEGQDTPVSVSTPIDILKATLGRPACEPILDVAGQKLRTHHRRGGDGVHRACTCGCTEVIQAIFESKEEVAKKDDIQAALDDMVFFVQCHVQRIDEYRRFADDLIAFLREKGKTAPELKPFLESLEQIAQQIPQKCTEQKENMKSLDYASDLTRQTMALTQSQSPNNLKAYMELLKAWRAMGGAQDDVVAHCHMFTRKLFQEAGYGCVSQAIAVAVAQEVRARCRQVFRNPDGYEIWANY